MTWVISSNSRILIIGAGGAGTDALCVAQRLLAAGSATFAGFQPALNVLKVGLDNNNRSAERIGSSGLSRSQTGAPAIMRIAISAR